MRRMGIAQFSFALQGSSPVRELFQCSDRALSNSWNICRNMSWYLSHSVNLGLEPDDYCLGDGFETVVAKRHVV